MGAAWVVCGSVAVCGVPLWAAFSVVVLLYVRGALRRLGKKKSRLTAALLGVVIVC